MRSRHRHLPLTVITPIRPDETKSLRRTLEDLPPPIEGEQASGPFVRVETVHFARWTILESGIDHYGRTTAATLVFITDSDATGGSDGTRRHLRDLAIAMEDELDAVYRHCEDYDAGGGHDAMVEYLHAHSVRAAGYFVGAVGRSVEQIRREALLRDRIRASRQKGEIATLIDEFVRTPLTKDQERAARRKIWDATRRILGEDPDLLWAKTPPPRLPHATAFWRLMRKIERPLRSMLRWGRPTSGNEGRVEPVRKDVAQGEEARTGNNPFGHLVTIREGRLRGLRRALRFFAWRIRGDYVEGDLGGVDTIHFARWVVVDEGRRLLFMSAYYSNWERYFHGFIDYAAEGINLIWKNTEGYPPVRWLFFGGCREHRNEFLDWVRARQVLPSYWYCAYPQIMISSINNNTRLHAGFAADDMTDEQIEEWLNLRTV